MNLVQTPRILQKLFPAITWEMPGEKPCIYLSFDDGPTTGITAEVLQILHRFQALATFFCIGRNVERHPDIYRQILDEGHTTGNHTYSHLKGWFTPDQEYYEDIRLASGFIQSGLYRPAYGMITTSQLRYLQEFYRIVMWSIMSYDFDSHTPPEKCLNNVIRNAHAGSVIVFHDSLKASEKVLHALPRVLEYFSERGFVFKPIGTL